MHIDGNQNKETVLRRLLKAFQKGVGGLGIEPVCRIDNENLVAPFEWLEIEHSKDPPNLRNLDLRGVFLHRNRHHVGMYARFGLSAARTLATEFPGFSLEA